MSVRKTKEDFIEKANISHNNFYSYDKIDYVDRKTKVKIICPIHGAFDQKPKSHLRGYGCRDCAGTKPHTKETIIAKFKEKFGDKFDYSKFVFSGMDKCAIVICPEHGEQLRPPADMLRLTYGCIECGGRIIYTNEKIDNILINDNRTIIRLGEFIETSAKLEWQCKVCDYKWDADPYEVLYHDKTGCPKCSGHMRLNNQIIDERLEGRNIKRVGNFKTGDEILEWLCEVCNYRWPSYISDVFGERKIGCPSCSDNMPLTNDIIDERLKGLNLIRLGNYINNHTKLDFKCTECHHIWPTATKVIFNIGCGCPSCASCGKNERKVRDLFLANNIEFIYQYSLLNFNIEQTRPYRFDFYIPSIKFAIEYNGSQHYRPVKFGGMEQDVADANFEKQKLRDEYVRKFCLDNHIQLLELDGRHLHGNKLIQYLQTTLIPLLQRKGNTPQCPSSISSP